MNIFDHVFAFCFVALFPASGFVLFRRTVEAIKRGEASRLRLYARTTTTQWILAAMTLAIWLGHGRDWDALGLGFEPDAGFAVAGAITILGLAILVGQLRAVWKSTPDELGKSVPALGDLVWILPHDRRELRSFDRLSVTAGIVEELLWRGFLIWYLAHWMPLWGAALISATLFGLAHAYQGIGGIAKTAAAGLISTALFLLSGSLWLPMLLHIATDMLQGRVAAHIIFSSGPPATE